jgi:hypothetical protein
MRARVLFLLLSTAVALTACARALANLGTVDRKIGRATSYDIMREVPSVLQLYGYAIYQNRPTSSALYIETGWQERAPFDDETERGVEYARTRFIARGRKSGPTTYTLTISAENQVRTAADTAPEIAGVPAPEWSTMPPTDMYMAYVREITGEIEMKVSAGLRRYDAQPASAVAGSMAPFPSPR